MKQPQLNARDFHMVSGLKRPTVYSVVAIELTGNQNLIMNLIATRERVSGHYWLRPQKLTRTSASLDCEYKRCAIAYRALARVRTCVQLLGNFPSRRSSEYQKRAMKFVAVLFLVLVAYAVGRPTSTNGRGMY